MRRKREDRRLSDGLHSLTVEEAIRLIRREAGRLSRTQSALEQIQRAIEAPSADELRRMEEGTRLLSIEAHVIARLQWAILEVERVEKDLRYSLWKSTLLALAEPGTRATEEDLSLIRAALEARRDSSVTKLSDGDSGSQLEDSSAGPVRP